MDWRPLLRQATKLKIALPSRARIVNHCCVPSIGHASMQTCGPFSNKVCRGGMTLNVSWIEPHTLAFPFGLSMNDNDSGTNNDGVDHDDGDDMGGLALSELQTSSADEKACIIGWIESTGGHGDSLERLLHRTCQMSKAHFTINMAAGSMLIKI